MRTIVPEAKIAHLGLAELQRLTEHTILALSQDLQEMMRAEQARANNRSERAGTVSLVEEFIAPFCGHVPQFRYELAFLPGWWASQSTLPLYEARWWICSYTAGVYFIYDAQEQLQYVGSCCGGYLGNRIYRRCHKPYTCAVDIVLFDRQWCHLALAFEALAISRLKPPRNKKMFKDLWVQPIPPFDKVWRRTAEAAGTEPEEPKRTWPS